MRKIVFLPFLLFLPLFSICTKGTKELKLKPKGDAFSLRVDGEPFLILGGELGNSTASNIESINAVWPHLHAMKLNTVLIPIYWELFEPVEGEFDFSLVDGILAGAREHNMKVVFLWFGSWKNSMSCYVPLWVKNDWKRFPRVLTKDGTPQEILTPFSSDNLEIDKRAYVQLLSHLAKFDNDHRTVLMIQLQNEIGMIPDARDYSEVAEEAFQSKVPEQVFNLLEKPGKLISQHLYERWSLNEKPVEGSWAEVFGDNLFTDELFMTWYYGLYVEEMAAAGKEVYDLPVFLNAALNSRGRKPGAYPSAGPLAHLMDMWKLVAPSVDFYAPDIYDPGFDKWCKQYHVPGINPLFIPEIRNEAGNDARVFYAFGAHDALGFSPFSIEDTPNPFEAPLTKSYEILHQLLPLIAKKQGEGGMSGVWLHEEMRDTTFIMDSYKFNVSHDYTLGWSPKANDGSLWPESGALIISLGNDEYMVAGTGVVITFESANEEFGRAGIGQIDRVRNKNRQWKSTLRLNGDQSHQGRHLRIPVDEYDIQKLKLYRYL